MHEKGDLKNKFKFKSDFNLSIRHPILRGKPILPSKYNIPGPDVGVDEYFSVLSSLLDSHFLIPILSIPGIGK